MEFHNSGGYIHDMTDKVFNFLLSSSEILFPNSGSRGCVKAGDLRFLVMSKIVCCVYTYKKVRCSVKAFGQ